MKLLNKQHRSSISLQDTLNEEKQVNSIKSGEDEPDPDNSKEINNCSIAQKMDEFWLRKTKLLYEHGVFTWKKSVLTKHREINEKLEALGVYQGKKPDQIDYGSSEVKVKTLVRLWQTLKNIPLNKL